MLWQQYEYYYFSIIITINTLLFLLLILSLLQMKRARTNCTAVQIPPNIIIQLYHIIHLQLLGTPHC